MPAMDADTPNKPFGGTEEIAFTPDGAGPRLRGQGRRPRGGLVHGLRPLLCAHRRLGRPALPDRGQQGHGHPAGLLAGREDPGLRGHGPSRLRGRPLPHRAPRLAGRTAARPDRGLGLLGGLARLEQGRQEDPGHRPQQGPDLALRRRRRDRQGGHARRPRHRGRFRARGRRRRLRAEHPDLADRDLFHRAGRGREGPDRDQRGQARGRPDGRARAVQLQGLEQRDGLRLHRQAGRFRSRPRNTRSPS